VQGRVVRTSIVVAPGGPTVRAAAAPNGHFHRLLPGESVSDAWHVGAVSAGHSYPVGADED